MTRFAVSLIIQCPTDWTVEKAREFVNARMLSSQEEKDSLEVMLIMEPLPREGLIQEDRQQ